LLARAAAVSSIARAIAGSLIDIAAASYLMVLLGEAGTALVTIYAITCLDTGLQYGRKGLATTSLVALAGFAVVWSYTDFWQAQPSAALAVVAAFVGAVIATGLNARRPTGALYAAAPATGTEAETTGASARVERPESTRADAVASDFAPEPVVDLENRGARRRSPTRQKILVVDDNATNRIIAEAILNSAGHQTDAVDNAPSALERLVSGRYRLAIVDMHMPDMSGVALLRRYRNMCPTDRVPIVMLTANASSEAAQEAADAGADGFLTKPVSARSLVTTVEKLLADSEAGTLRPVSDRPSEDNGPTRIIDAAVIRELQEVCGSPEEFSGLVMAFRDEGAALLHGFSKAIGSGDLKSGIDCALALRASAVNFGGLALAESCEWVSQLNESQFRAIGQEAVERVTLRYEATIRELDRLVENARGQKVQSLPRSST
jgi:CheY-like chemotaxis protein